MKKISIIIPVYNVEKYIEKCLMSIINQTIDDIEIIAINDGSKDNSGEIIDNIVSMFPDKVKVIHQKNSGVSAARNAGLAIATGEYIGFVDSDDYIEPDMYQLMYDKAKSNDFDMVTADVNIVYPTKNKIISSGIDKDITDYSEIRSSLITSYAVIWNKIYKREILNGINFKENVWYEDVDFLFKLFPKLKTIGVVRKPLYNYIQRDGSITYTYNEKLYQLIENFDGLIEYYKENNYYDTFFKEIEYSYVRYLYATFIKRLSKMKDYKKFNDGVKYVIKKVNEKFPNYKKNYYIKKYWKKGLYLKHFNPTIAKMLYIKEKNRMN